LTLLYAKRSLNATGGNSVVTLGDIEPCGVVCKKMAEVHGNRTLAPNAGKTMVETQSGGKCGALGAPDGPAGGAGPERSGQALSASASDVSSGDVDLDLVRLRRIVTAWPTLPADVRANILAMVNAASDGS
jgi:hypothetical protein